MITRNHEVQLLEKLLEDASIEQSLVAADITGVSGRAMLEAGGCSPRWPRPVFRTDRA